MADRETELLENVELRMALADTDAKFERVIHNFLAPVLLKLDSPHDVVRQKVISMCNHAHKRLKSSISIQVPVETLLQSFTKPSASVLQRNLILSFIEAGYSRLDTTESVRLLPLVLSGISTRSYAQRTTLLSIALPIISNYKEKTGPGAAPQIKDPFDFKSNPEDLKFLLNCFMDVMLYTVPSSGRTMTARNAAEYANTPVLTALDVIPPGSSKDAVLLITNNLQAAWSKSNLDVRDLKISLARFVMNVNFVPEKMFILEKFIIYIICAGDTFSEVQSIGNDGLKRSEKPNFEDPVTVFVLYSLYLGSNLPDSTTNRDGTSAKSKTDYIRGPVPTSIKQLVIEFLLRSALATNFIQLAMQVAFDALYGQKTTHKLRSGGMSFVQWIARMSDTAKLEVVSPVLLTGLLKFIDDYTEENGNDSESLRGFAYEAVGLLSKRVPAPFQKDITILYNFFTAVSAEQRNVRVSVLEALFNMISAYKEVANDQVSRNEIEAILLANVDKAEHQARYAAVKYAVNLFPFSSPVGRYICILASADSKLEVREEAKKGLGFPEIGLIGGNEAEESAILTEWKAKLPNINTTVAYLYSMSKRLRTGITLGTLGSKWILNMPVETYTYQLEFLRRLIVLTADPRAQLNNFNKVEDPVSIVSAQTRDKLTVMLKHMWDSEHADANTMQVDKPKNHISGLLGYIHFIDEALKSPGADGVLQLVASTYLLELVSLGPLPLCMSYSNKIDWIKSFLSTIKSETRMNMAHILGIIATVELTDSARLHSLKLLLTELYETAKDTSKQKSDIRHGAILGLGFVIGRIMYRYPKSDSILSQSLISSYLDAIVGGLGHDHSFIVIASCQALAEVGRYAPLKFSKESTSSIKSVLTQLIELSKNMRDAKVQEAAIFAIGHIGLGSPEIVDDAIAFVLTLPSIFSKHAEMHFNIGDTVCTLLFGFQATHMIEFLDIPQITFPPLTSNTRDSESVSTPDPTKAVSFVTKMLELLQPGGAAATRKAVCIWLLCVVKYCGHTSHISENALAIHSAFSGLLGDRDEFTQEVASKGIGIIYDIGNQKVKDELVRSLVSTFTEGRRLAPQSVTGDTQLFDNQTLGTTPDGSNITTYQSILSLAADMNQPDLVYKFMSLASHHSIWNSRRGASMGFESIAAQAERELQQHLPSLVPRLYRYQFDPNQKVAESMKNIWRALVKNPKKAMDTYMDLILEDILNSLGDRMWRTREASCAALADFLSGRQMSEMEPYLQRLWTMCFRALDDIKETVRNAAFLTCKTLTKMTVRYCDPSNVAVEQGQKIMDIIVPFLLTKGLGSMAEEVRKFSLTTVLRLCKNGGVLLKPHITELVGTLLESLSSLEPQVMNYLTFHADKYNVTQEQLDTSRLSAARNSPMMDAIEQCIGQVDAKVVESLIPRLCTIIRKGIGLPTRAGTARFVYLLVQRLPLDFKPHADIVLKALSGTIQDRSPVVRKTFAVAIGHTCKLASDSAVARIITYLKKGYLESEDATDPEAKSIAGVVFLEMSRTAGDKLKSFHSDVLPLAYIGARDGHDGIHQVWENVWEENTAGASGAAKLWVKEILDLCQTLLKESPSWPVKRQVGKSIADLSKTLGEGFEPYMAQTVPFLLENLAGRTWDGKEALLEGLANVAVAGKGWLKTDTVGKALVSELETVFVREAKKNSQKYRRLAIEYLGTVFDALDIGNFDDLIDYLIDVATESNKNDMDVDDDREKPLALVIQANAFTAIGQCFPRTRSSQVAHTKQIVELLAKSLEGNVWNIRMAALGSLSKVFEKLLIDPIPIDLATTHVVMNGLFVSLDDSKYTAIRIKSSTVMLEVIQKLNVQLPLPAELKDSIVSKLETIIPKETAAAVEFTLKEIRGVVSGMPI
ncbi:proteasome component M29 [Batrachochytrium dendrobatidis]|nr:proteasome component M29 [Batrachochytrium dendrobatidis]